MLTKRIIPCLDIKDGQVVKGVNFKNLVKSINYDPAMLIWLDNDQNYFVSENNFTFNENYARELLELFTMGEGQYTQFDIEEAEFTGGHPENIKYEDVTIEQYGNHGSDFTEVEKYATGKTSKGSKAQRQAWEPDWDDSLPDYEDYASGGLAYALGE